MNHDVVWPPEAPGRVVSEFLETTVVEIKLYATLISARLASSVAFFGSRSIRMPMFVAERRVEDRDRASWGTVFVKLLAPSTVGCRRDACQVKEDKFQQPQVDSVGPARAALRNPHTGKVQKS
jgi:hypothetical protein